MRYRLNSLASYMSVKDHSTLTMEHHVGEDLVVPLCQAVTVTRLFPCRSNKPCWSRHRSRLFDRKAPSRN